MDKSVKKQETEGSCHETIRFEGEPFTQSPGLSHGADSIFLEGGGNKLKTGFVGTPLLCGVLSDFGMEELAYTLLLNEDYPGWLNEVKLGATTVWERWNSLLADGSISGISMNSMNHYAYGSVAEWMFCRCAGFDPMENAPGFKEVRIEPLLSRGLGSLKAEYDSPAGLYRSAWKFTDDTHVELSVTVPFGCNAALKLPGAGRKVYENKNNPMLADVREGVCYLEPGDYSIAYEWTEEN